MTKKYIFASSINAMSNLTLGNAIRIIQKSFLLFLRLLAVAIIITTVWVTYYRYYNPSETGLMRLRIEQAKNMNKKIKISYTWRDYNKISARLKKAVVFAEDATFFQHKGFNFKAIRLAYLKNRELGVNKYGASTISQQTAKNLFLWNGKSWLRKILEGYFTILIETIWGKKRILEVYLNIIEYGEGVFGAEAASLLYFEVPAKDLNQYQASLLAVILPNPRKWNLHAPSKKIIFRARLNKIFVLLNDKMFSEKDL